jgi:hypothetical protein
MSFYYKIYDKLKNTDIKEGTNDNEIGNNKYDKNYSSDEYAITRKSTKNQLSNQKYYSNSTLSSILPLSSSHPSLDSSQPTQTQLPSPLSSPSLLQVNHKSNSHKSKLHHKSKSKHNRCTCKRDPNTCYNCPRCTMNYPLSINSYNNEDDRTDDWFENFLKNPILSKVYFETTNPLTRDTIEFQNRYRLYQQYLESHKLEQELKQNENSINTNLDESIKTKVFSQKSINDDFKPVPNKTIERSLLTSSINSK